MGYLKLDILTLVERPVAIALDRTIVNEDISATLLLNETISF